MPWIWLANPSRRISRWLPVNVLASGSSAVHSVTTPRMNVLGWAGYVVGLVSAAPPFSVCTV